LQALEICPLSGATVVDHEMDNTVAGRFRKARRMMREAGFEMGGDIQVVVDEGLPFIGYTSETRDGHLIVVSGFAARSPMLEGLLIHEMSHIYRTMRGHPSHDRGIITEVANSLARQHEVSKEYQGRILHQVINHLQDLYADDSVIRVFTRNQRELPSMDQLADFS